MSEAKRLMAGKWLRPEVPQRDWHFARMVDTGPKTMQICQMCEARHVRYVHMMEHSAWPEPLGVGAECAARMEGLARKEVRQREAALKREAVELERWMRTGWHTERKGDGRNITYTYKDQPPWRIELCTIGELTSLALRHLDTWKVVAEPPPCPPASAKRAAWDLWHEGEALRTSYLAELAEARRQQREREEEAERAEKEARWAKEANEEEARQAKWKLDHPDWDASVQAWSDWLDWQEQNTVRRQFGPFELKAVPSGFDVDPADVEAALARASAEVERKLASSYGAAYAKRMMAKWDKQAAQRDKEAALKAAGDAAQEKVIAKLKRMRAREVAKAAGT